MATASWPDSDQPRPRRAPGKSERGLVPLVTSILTAPTSQGFGFGIAAGTLPAHGTRTDRQHLDALLALAPVSVQEFANRYRLPLTEPDSATSTQRMF